MSKRIQISGVPINELTARHKSMMRKHLNDSLKPMYQGKKFAVLKNSPEMRAYQKSVKDLRVAAGALQKLNAKQQAEKLQDEQLARQLKAQQLIGEQASRQIPSRTQSRILMKPRMKPRSDQMQTNTGAVPRSSSKTPDHVQVRLQSTAGVEDINIFSQHDQKKNAQFLQVQMKYNTYPDVEEVFGEAYQDKYRAKIEAARLENAQNKRSTEAFRRKLRRDLGN